MLTVVCSPKLFRCLLEELKSLPVEGHKVSYLSLKYGSFFWEYIFQFDDWSAKVNNVYFPLLWFHCNNFVICFFLSTSKFPWQDQTNRKISPFLWFYFGHPTKSFPLSFYPCKVYDFHNEMTIKIEKLNHTVHINELGWSYVVFFPIVFRSWMD